MLSLCRKVLLGLSLNLLAVANVSLAAPIMLTGDQRAARPFVRRPIFLSYVLISKYILRSLFMKLSSLSLNPVLALGALALAAALSAQPAAAASYCSAGSAIGLSLADMTFNGAQASDCYGVVMGNDKLSAVNSLTWGNDWTLLTKDESMRPATFMGIAFELGTSDGKSGTWTLAGTDINGAPLLNLPAELDLVAVLKASNRYAVYFFDDVVLDGTDGGTWSIPFLNHGGQIPGLSHMSVYVRIDEDGGMPSAIPEAHTYGMMLVGLGLVGFVARRRIRQVA